MTTIDIYTTISRDYKYIIIVLLKKLIKIKVHTLRDY